MCTNLLCLPPDVVDLIYFLIMLIANILNCLVGLASVYRVIRRQPLCKPHDEDDETLPGGTLPAMSVVVACYLPNEQFIIESTIDHIMHQLEWNAPVTLYIVYNTPSALPFEQTLNGFVESKRFIPGRKLQVVKVDGSTSKADNLNYILPQLQVVLPQSSTPCSACLAARSPLTLRRRMSTWCCTTQTTTRTPARSAAWPPRYSGATTVPCRAPRTFGTRVARIWRVPSTPSFS